MIKYDAIRASIWVIHLSTELDWMLPLKAIYIPPEIFYALYHSGNKGAF